MAPTKKTIILLLLTRIKPSFMFRLRTSLVRRLVNFRRTRFLRLVSKLFGIILIARRRKITRIFMLALLVPKLVVLMRLVVVRLFLSFGMVVLLLLLLRESRRKLVAGRTLVVRRILVLNKLWLFVLSKIPPKTVQ